MAYEVFTRKVARTTTPAITINTLGKISFNQSATEIIRNNKMEHVLLLWDKDRSKMAIQPTTKADTRAYHVGFAKSGSGFSAKTFFAHIKYEASAKRVFVAQWNPKEKLLEIELSHDILQVTQPLQRRRGRPRKTELPLL